MRIHSDVIVPLDIHGAAKYATDKAEAGLVTARPITKHGSRSHDASYEMALIGDGSVKRHRTMDKQDYSATWDSWGYALAYLYSIDPFMKTSADKTRIDFEVRTDGAFPLPRVTARQAVAAL